MGDDREVVSVPPILSQLSVAQCVGARFPILGFDADVADTEDSIVNAVIADLVTVIVPNNDSISTSGSIRARSSIGAVFGVFEIGFDIGEFIEEEDTTMRQ